MATSLFKRTVSSTTHQSSSRGDEALDATWRTQLGSPLPKGRLSTVQYFTDRRYSANSAMESIVASLSSGVGRTASTVAPPPKVLTEADLSQSQKRRLQQLYEDYCQQAALRGTADFEVVGDLLGKVDTSLLDKKDQLSRLRRCGYNPLQCPVLPFPVLVQYALKNQALADPPLPKDEQETIDAFVCLGGSRDKSGFITTETLRGILENFKIMLDVQALLDEVDTDGSGTVEFDEFDEFYRKKRQSLAAAAKEGAANGVSQAEDEDDTGDTITRTLSMTSNEAYKMLSNILLYGDPDEDEWQVKGANLARLQRQQEDEDRNNKYILEDGEPTPLLQPMQNMNTASQQIFLPHRSSLAATDSVTTPVAASTMAASGLDGPRVPRGVHFSPPATPGGGGGGGIDFGQRSPQVGALNLSFNDASSFASSQNFGSPTASLNNGSGLAMSSMMGSSFGGRRRATTVRREKTAAALLTDALNVVLDGHGAKLREVGHKHNSHSARQQHFTYYEEVDHVTELAVASVERARRLSDIHDKQQSRFNERVEQKRGSDFGVTTSNPPTGQPSMPPSRPTSAKLGPAPPPAPPTPKGLGRPPSSTSLREARAITPPHFELPRNCLYSVPKSLQEYDDTHPRQQPIRRRSSAPVPHYAQPKGAPTSSLMALIEAKRASEELNARSKHLGSKMEHADRKVEAAHRVLEFGAGVETLVIHEEVRPKANAYEDEIRLDDDDELVVAAPPRLADLLKAAAPVSSNTIKVQRPTTAPLFRKPLPPHFKSSMVVSPQPPPTGIHQSSQARRPMSAQARPASSKPREGAAYPSSQFAALAGKDFYSAFAASAPLSARRAAHLAASRPASAAPRRPSL